MNEPKMDVAAELQLLAVKVRMANSMTPDSVLEGITDSLLDIQTARLKYEKERIRLLWQLLPVLKEKAHPRMSKVAWFLLWNSDVPGRDRLKALRVYSGCWVFWRLHGPQT